MIWIHYNVIINLIYLDASSRLASKFTNDRSWQNVPRGLFLRHFVAAMTGICKLSERGLDKGTQAGSRPRAATTAAGPASRIPWINSVGLPGFAAWANNPESARFWASSSRMRLCNAPISSLRPYTSWKKRSVCRSLDYDVRNDNGKRVSGRTTRISKRKRWKIGRDWMDKRLLYLY